MIFCVIHGITYCESWQRDFKRLWSIFPATNDPSIGMEKKAVEHLHGNSG
jgi:hypothetical protein